MLNSVDDILLRTSFRTGERYGAESVRKGTFTVEQFEAALQMAYEELLARLPSTESLDDVSSRRKAELTIAEGLLAEAWLCQWFGQRIAISYPESNMSAVGGAGVTSGADTPDPFTKYEAMKKKADELRSQAYALITGTKTFLFGRFSLGYDDETFPYYSAFESAYYED